jgi:L-alanine-DL-glutamate epimerase-like enolase superfamily enzyme
MKITAVKPVLLKKQLSSSMRISRGGFDTRYHALVQVETDAGLTGLGEGVGNAHHIFQLLQGPYAEMALGLDPMNIEGVRAKLLDSKVYFERMGSGICAASAIETACWDIKGKALQVPVHQLLGGCVRDRLEAYVSDIYWEQDPATMAKEARRIVDRGFQKIKAHIGFQGPRQDKERVRALRTEIGPDIGLMIDLNCGYSYLDAVRAGREWEEFGLFWLEEPLNPNLAQRLGQLKSEINIPIAAGENEFRTYGFKNLFDHRAVDVAMPDVARIGGIQETKNVCVLAEAYGVDVSPHCFSSGVLLAATMHVMASTPNASLLEFDSSQNAVIEELLEAPLQIRNGQIAVPQSPGLGVSLTHEVIRKYAV